MKQATETEVYNWIMDDAELNGAENPHPEITIGEGLMVIDKHGRRWIVSLSEIVGR